MPTELENPSIGRRSGIQDRCAAARGADVPIAGGTRAWSSAGSMAEANIWGIVALVVGSVCAPIGERRLRRPWVLAFAWVITLTAASIWWGDFMVGGFLYPHDRATPSHR